MISAVQEISSAGKTRLSLTPGVECSLSRAVCQLAHLDEERTHRLSVDLEDGAGIIDIFVTITGTTPQQEATSEGDSANNVALDAIPSKLTPEEIQHYVRIDARRAAACRKASISS